MKKKIMCCITSLSLIITFLMSFGFSSIVAFAYDANAAIKYADTYWSSYNPDYSNYNSIGGDCANFVSQCLVAGGMEMTSGWYWYSYNNRSASWASCPAMYDYFNKAGYTIIENPSDAQVKEGNPVLYYSSSKGRWSHAAICTGHDSSGNALVSAHNSDRHNVNWKLGTGWSKRCTIIINEGPIPNNDTVAPVISSISVTETSSNGYTISCEVSDNYGLARVLFPTWTGDSQDDIIWEEGTANGNKYSYRVNISDHNNETNTYYHTHIWAYDTSNNASSAVGADIFISQEAPAIENVWVNEISDIGYTVWVKVESPENISRVLFPTWTGEEQDDITWQEGTYFGDGTYYYYVRTDEHDNETSVYYHTHIVVI